MLDHTFEAPEFLIKLNVCIFLVEDFEKGVRKRRNIKVIQNDLLRITIFIPGVNKRKRIAKVLLLSKNCSEKDVVGKEKKQPHLFKINKKLVLSTTRGYEMTNQP